MKTKLKGLLFGIFVFTVTSCIKDVPGIENTTSNIFDHDYNGEQWFVVNDVYKYVNEFSLQLVKFEIEIPKTNLPSLKPTALDIGWRLKGDEWNYSSILQNNNGGYDFVQDFAINASDTYCIEIGIPIEDSESIINNFSECVNL